MLLGRPREIGSTGVSGAVPPDRLLPSGDARGEDLVLQVAVEEPGPLDQLDHPLRLVCGPGEGLLAADADQIGGALGGLLGYGLDDPQPHEVGVEYPDGVHRAV